MRADKENQGALFKNNKKEKDTHPDYKGVLNVGGEEFWLNAWINTSQAGQKYMAIRVNPKEEQRNKPAVNGGSRPDPDDEIPF